MEDLHRWDLDVSTAIYKWFDIERNSSTRIITKVLENTAHGLLWLLCTLLAITSLPSAYATVSVNMMICLLVDICFVGAMKLAFKRSRPGYNKADMFATVSVDANYSFPSGHTTRAFMCLAFVWFTTQEPRLRAWASLWACLVALSRVVLGRHHVLDVAAGVPLGVLFFLFAYALLWVDAAQAEVVRLGTQGILSFFPFTIRASEWSQ